MQANLTDNPKTYFSYYKEAIAVINKYIPQKKESPEVREDLLSNPQFKALMDVFPGALFVLDFPTRGYTYASGSTKEILGYTPEEFYEGGFRKTVELFPESQNEVILNQILPMIFDYFEEYRLKGDIKDLRITYNTLIIKKDRTVGHYLHQMKVIHTDEDKRPYLILKLISEIGNIGPDNIIRMTIAHKDDKGNYFPAFTQNFLSNRSEQILSLRESEILNLISQGKSSSEVGDLLCISENTVYKHRKNMLKKMDAKNTGELLSKAIACGMI